MEHRHDHGGLVPFTAAISTDAAGILSSLSHALGSGNDLSPVIEKLALSILPEWRQLQFEKHAHQKQIDDLQGKIAALEQDLTAATVAALATPTNATRMSDELFSTGAPEAATQPDGGLSSLATYQGKRFLKSIHELDPSARRKRRAKFVKCLTELSDTYGIDMSYLSAIVAELQEAPSQSHGHARVNSAPSAAAHAHAHAYYVGQGSHGVQQHPAFIMPSHLSSAAPSSSTSPAMGAYMDERGQMRQAPALALAPAASGAVGGFAPMAPQPRPTEDDVTMAPVSKSMDSDTARPCVLDTATVVDPLTHEEEGHGTGGGGSEDPGSGTPPSTTSTSTSSRSLESAGRPTVKGGAAQRL